jgi:competence protein ComEA
MMIKKSVAASAMLFALASWAAVDVNKASEAELDSLKGVGPSLSKRILDAREQGEFKDWADFMSRVKGVKEKSAAKLSSEGLTIGGQQFGTVAEAEAAPAAKQAPQAAKPVQALQPLRPAQAAQAARATPVTPVTPGTPVTPAARKVEPVPAKPAAAAKS